MLLGLTEGPWTVEDRLLAIALTTYEDGLCPGCGHPMRKTTDPRASGNYEVTEHDCEGCAELGRHQAEHKDDKKVPGRKVSVVDAAPRS